MLHVWLRAQHSPLLVWQPDSKQWQPCADWQQLRQVSNTDSVCLYFPSRHIQQISTELSSAQLKQLGVAGKQYLFEEASLTPPEQLNVREVSGAAGQYLYAVSENDIQAWEQSARLGECTIIALLPDFLLLPIPSEGAGQQIALYQDTQTTLLRQSKVQGMAASYLPLVFERMPHLSEVLVLKSVETSDTDTSTYPALNADVPNTDTVNINPNPDQAYPNATKGELDQQISPEVIITQLSAVPEPVTAPERHALNFFVKPTSFNFSSYLKVTIMVALAALVLQLSADALQWYRYQQAVTATKLATKAQYDAWFPDEPLSPTNTLQVQLKPKLATGTPSDSDHLSLLSRIAPLLKQSSVVAQALKIEPTAISFTVIGDNRDSLDKFASSLIAQGVDANLGSVSTDADNRVIGQITIQITDNPESSAIS